MPIMGAPGPQVTPIVQHFSPYNQPTTQPTQAPTQQPIGEIIVGVVLFRKMKSMGRWDTYTGVVTTQRLIFAEITSQMLADAAKQSRDQAKAEGKGFFGQWADPLRATFGYSQKYLSMSPQSILAETPGNFALDNNTISEISVHLRGTHDGHNQRENLKSIFIQAQERISTIWMKTAILQIH